LPVSKSSLKIAIGEELTTISVWAEVAELEPPALEAVTVSRTVLPRSALTSV
jgi:hypothetical protein